MGPYICNLYGQSQSLAKRGLPIDLIRMLTRGALYLIQQMRWWDQSLIRSRQYRTPGGFVRGIKHRVRFHYHKHSPFCGITTWQRTFDRLHTWVKRTETFLLLRCGCPGHLGIALHQGKKSNQLSDRKKNIIQLL